MSKLTEYCRLRHEERQWDMYKASRRRHDLSFHIKCSLEESSINAGITLSGMHKVFVQISRTLYNKET